ncbi:MAG: glycoside hydrolase family 18 protein [Sandaracinaceae bacterium]|nr:glycoside hydrolase family 18 protein [Sandaracinaceae bacterium]
MRALVLPILLSLGSACGGAASPDAGGRDATAEPADGGGSPIDAGPGLDAGPATDAGPRDGGQLDAGTAADPDQWVMGYYVSYQRDDYPIAEIDWSGLTHIAFSPLAVRGGPGYALDFSFSGAFGSDAAGRAFAMELAAAAHANGVRTILMLGGAGLSDNVRPAMTQDLDGFVARLLEAMDTLGYDGIDLDVEASNFATSDAIELARALRMARPSILLSYPGGTVQYGTTVDPDLPELVTYLDRYFMQSYFGGNNGLFTGTDFRGMLFQSWFSSALHDPTELHPYAIDWALEQLVAAGIPARKLGMGVAFYAACYLVPDTTPPGGSDVSAPRMPAYAPSSYCWDCGIGGGDNNFSLATLFAGGGPYSQGTPMFDAAAASPYLTFATPRNVSACGGSTRYIVFEDEQSLMAKGAFSRANGYGGIIIWTIQQGYLPAGAAGGRPRNALMQALRRGFIAP